MVFAFMIAHDDGGDAVGLVAVWAGQGGGGEVEDAEAFLDNDSVGECTVASTFDVYPGGG